MNLTFKNCRISGVLAVVPANERSFVEEMTNFNFPIGRSLKLKQLMGYDKHRIVDGPVCVSDLACFAMQHLFEVGLLARNEFDALFLITQSPDHFMPPTSSIIHGRLNLSSDMLCLDINQGCAGFVVGLFQAFQFLQQSSVRKVVLINADVISRKVSREDRNSYPLIGDAVAITVLERSDDPTTIYGNIRMDGTRREALMIPAGGFRLPSSTETAVLETDSDNNIRAKDHLRMDGTAVFNFVQVDVPPLIEDLLRVADANLDEVDYFLFHQPNRFMLRKLAERMGVPLAKMPSNVVEKYGNSSGVTIPVAMADNLREKLLSGTVKACLSGFGVGLTWAAMLLPLGPLDFCELIDFQ